jgi:hypothetical protein
VTATARNMDNSHNKPSQTGDSVVRTPAVYSNILGSNLGSCWDIMKDFL